MPKSIQISTMAAKYLADFVAHTGWAEKGHEDVYLGGSILADVLPRFEEPPEPVTPAPATDETADPAIPATPPLPPPIYIKPLESPVAPALQADGSPDWSKMSRAEADDFRKKVTEHNRAFIAWCRKPLPRALILTDKQLETCQRVLKYYSPRPDADKAKDKEKQQAARPELPLNEFTYQLLKELNLSVSL